ncbi:hypothetical protein CR513_10834, partial [Mucuna pruriens]
MNSNFSAASINFVLVPTSENDFDGEHNHLFGKDYHKIQVMSMDIPKTTFKTHYNHYVYMVMSFGVTNALGLFMNYMNKIFHPYLDKARKEHVEHLRVVLQVLKDKQ